MEELISQISAAARGMWKYRWQGLVAAWVVAIIGVAVVLRQPNRYEADARIFVDTQTILKPLMSGLAVQPNIEQQVVMLSRTLLSRPNVEKLIRMADLDLKTTSKVEQDALVESLLKTLQIRSTQRDNLYTLSFQDPDPAKARRVIQSLVSIFVDSGLGANRKDTDSAKAFINDQIKSYEAKLDEAEVRLKEFRLRNLELQSVDGKDSASRLAEINAQLNQARLELREAERARDAARQQLAGEKGRDANLSTQSLLQESALSVSTPEIDARIDAQKRNLDGLLQRYTEQHPDIVSTRRLLQELEEQKRKDVLELRRAAMAAPAQAAAANNSLAYQELNRMAASSEVLVASLQARVAEYSSRYEQARVMMRTAPQLEAEAAQLNRDYNIHKKNYEDLVARREAAAMSGDLEVAAGVAEFRLIDPPRVSPKPVAPNRLLLMPLALVAALGAGLFTAFIFSQLRPVFHAATELRDKFDLPLLGVVSAVLSDADKRRERASLMRFSLASGSLVGAFILGLIALSILSY
ncbi:MAG: XrtA system polysaccharide chain length determinant [Pseudomonadota bacterium]